jgi:uncharacterized protein involved in outer membrane biogenesis
VIRGLSGTGRVDLKLRHVRWSDGNPVNDVAAQVELEPNRVRFESFGFAWEEGGGGEGNGEVRWAEGGGGELILGGNLHLKDLDLGPAWSGKSSPAVVEGKFDVRAQVSSRAPTWEELWRRAGGEFVLTSRGGVFRGIPVALAAPAAGTSRVAGLFAAAGSALGGLAGRREPSPAVTKAQAATEFATAVRAIAFDQLSLTLARDPALNVTLRDFALIAPELRLSGSGTVLHQGQQVMLDDSLVMEFRLRARGRQADGLRQLGVLEPAPDELGYYSCTMPIRIAGSLGQPDASDLNVRLAALLLEKPGVTERAGEFFNRLIGGGK